MLAKKCHIAKILIRTNLSDINFFVTFALLKIAIDHL